MPTVGPKERNDFTPSQKPRLPKRSGNFSEKFSPALILFLFLFLGSPSLSTPSPLDDIQASRHNLTASSSPDAPKACVVCHTEAIPGPPPTAAPEGKLNLEPARISPLWISNEARPYTVTASLSREKQPYNRPTGSSFDCLACHDGVLGKDTHGVNVAEPRLGAKAGDPHGRTMGRLGADPLSRVDHPISIPYPVKPNGQFGPETPTVTVSRYWPIPDRRPDGFVLPDSGASAYLDLPTKGSISFENLTTLVRTTSGMVQCDSCHNPHSEKIRPFLRVPSASLCLVCHDR
ncbi:MAG TPA: cytochrome c3 family protein [Candidatus Manganitrophaceae bacterium]|nr:cytochrome c3 family protein [Candidatus Manganitrophaceae bacterium]